MLSKSLFASLNSNFPSRAPEKRPERGKPIRRDGPESDIRSGTKSNDLVDATDFEFIFSKRLIAALRLPIVQVFSRVTCRRGFEGVVPVAHILTIWELAYGAAERNFSS